MSFVTIKESMIISIFLCLVDVKGTLQRAIGETQSASEQGTGREKTILLEECFVQKGIRMVDILEDSLRTRKGMPINFLT